jgi:hypothetical protein
VIGSCLALFFVPFAAVGLFTGVQAVRAASAGDWKQAALFGIFALCFGGVGFAGIAAAVVGRRKAVTAEALRGRHPEAPWLWRDDWASGRIKDTSRGTMLGAWLFAAFWNLVGVAPFLIMGREILGQAKPVALVVALIFPLIGIGLLVQAVRATLRYRRDGVSVLELRTIPGVVGHGLAGEVRTTSPVAAAGGFRAVLRCVRRVSRRPGKRRSTSESVLWQEVRQVRGQAHRGPGGMTTAIPVAFAIPPDALPSDGFGSGDRVLWRLEVSAGVPGVDFVSRFEVPVFRTEASGRPGDGGETTELTDSMAPAVYSQPPDSRIQVTTNRRGTEILFPAARNPGAAAGITAFLGLWLGCIWLMLYLKAPWIFPVVFGLFGLLIFWGALELWLRVTRVVVDGGTVTLASGFVVPTAERRFGAAEIADVTTTIGMQTGGTPYYDIVLLRADGKRLTAARAVRDKREAEWLAAAIKRAMALPATG